MRSTKELDFETVKNTAIPQVISEELSELGFSIYLINRENGKNLPPILRDSKYLIFRSKIPNTTFFVEGIPDNIEDFYECQYTNITTDSVASVENFIRDYRDKKIKL